jgi:hypothetical protein
MSYENLFIKFLEIIDKKEAENILQGGKVQLIQQIIEVKVNFDIKRKKANQTLVFGRKIENLLKYFKPKNF